MKTSIDKRTLCTFGHSEDLIKCTFLMLICNIELMGQIEIEILFLDLVDKGFKFLNYVTFVHFGLVFGSVRSSTFK